MIFLNFLDSSFSHVSFYPHLFSPLLFLLFPALTITFFIILVAAIVPQSIKLSEDANVFIVSAAFLAAILLGGYAFIYRHILPELNRIYGIIKRRRLSECRFDDDNGTLRKSHSSVAFEQKPTSQTDNEEIMLAILSKEINMREKEKVCRRHILHWKAMLTLISEDMIDGTGTNSGNVGASVHPMAVVPIK